MSEGESAGKWRALEAIGTWVCEITWAVEEVEALEEEE